MTSNIDPRDFSLFLAKKHNVPVLFDLAGNISRFEFPNWELCALPDGRVLDAIPLETGVFA